MDSSFNDYGFSAQILENLSSKKYTTPTDVQARAIPEIMAKKDVVIQSKTGSGKTAAFGLPIINDIREDVPAVQFLVLVPTRELAAQVRDEIISLAENTPLKLCAIYGGVDMGKQIKALRDGAQVVVGTPGRILDHLKRRTMSFSVVRGVILDEADKMLSMGFLPDVTTILGYLPKRRQVVMSSATFPFFIEQLIEAYMLEPVKLELSSDDAMPKEISHYFCPVETKDKEATLLALLEKEQPELSLIFCNTKVEVKSVHYFLTNAGSRAEALSSDLSQGQREKALKRLRSGISRHMVCTDLAARGIDIPQLTHVFNFSASNDPETYVHRTGRTGRAGKTGKAISLVSTLDLAGFQTALRSCDIDIVEIHKPTEEEISASRSQHHFEYLEGIDFAREADVRDEFSRLAERLTPEQVKSLLPLLLEQFHRPQETLVAQLEVEPHPPRTAESARPEREPRERERERGRDREHGRGRPRAGGRDRDRGRGYEGSRDRAPERSRDRDHDGGSEASRDRAPERSRDRDYDGDRNRRRSGSGDGRPPRQERGPRPDQGRDERRPLEAAPREQDGKKTYTTVCLGLGRLDGLDEMDIQNILRRQGKTRMEDIGDIAMKDHESFINIGSGSLENGLAADGKYFKSFELFLAKSPVQL